MSFSSEVKQELCNLQSENACCLRAELAGLTALCGSLVSESEGGGLRLRTENVAVAQRMHQLFNELFSVHPKRMATRKKDNSYIHLLQFYPNQHYIHIMKTLGLWQDNRVKFCADPFVTGDSCCRRAFLRGAFLGSGSVSAPEKSYHLEIETHYHGLARDIVQLFTDEEISARSVVRKSNYVIYIKDSEEIADTLTAFGATDSALSLYHIKIEKDMKNKINRRVNCETANLTKTANTAALQIVSINKIMASAKAASLPPALAELAELRLKNPEASLAELAALLDEPISKSAVSRRLQKLVSMAEDLE
ncbi:MAG: DNA-binding protein WhiA [Ruminococcaceae bacterium]|nr:DNA-binding protein WhiA [Oscillospiraceae bacterium]